MLKNSTLLLFAALILAGSCTKKPSTVIPEKVTDTLYIDTTKVDTSNVDTSFILHVSDMMINQVGKTNLWIEVIRNTATEKKVNLSFKDMPANIKAEFSQDGGYPDFTSNLMLDVMFMRPGVYPIKIVATPEGGKAKEYAVKLTVDTMEKKECNTMLSTSFKTIGTNFNGSVFDSMFYFSQTSLFVNNQYGGGVFLRNLPLYTDSVANNAYMTLRSTNLGDPLNNNAHVIMMLDCDSGKIDIPLQEVVGRKVSGPANNQNFIVWGSGTINAKQKTYEITYYTQPTVAGTPVPISYVMKGDFIY